jgi:hypothetical protein
MKFYEVSDVNVDVQTNLIDFTISISSSHLNINLGIKSHE